MTIFKIYFGIYYGKMGIYDEPISWKEYFNDLPMLLCFTLIFGVLGYIGMHQLNKHEKKQKSKNI